MSRLARRTVLASCGLALVTATWSWAQLPPSAVRSTADVRPRIPDEHDRPYNRETQSHRGWEIREPQYTVFATTSPDDARWAASHVAAAWNNASRLAGRWTAVQQNPDFGLSSLQVVIDGEPLRDRDAPLTTINVVGIQTQVQLNVAPGQPPLKQQLARLREAAALAMLHTAGLDSAAPPWVVAGIAAASGRQGLTDEQLRAEAASPSTAHFGGQQWRFAREGQDVLAYRRLDHDAAAAQVAFLLTGSDAQHAPEFLSALNQATREAARTAAEGGAFRAQPGDRQPASADTPFDSLLAERRTQFEEWQQEPLSGQPVFEPPADADPELIAAEREMLVLLKLQRRLAATSSDPQRSFAAGVPRTKVVTFDPAKGASSRPGRSKPTIATFSDLAARLSDPAQGVWATLDVDGSLLLSTDTERVQALLATAENRYSLETSSGRTTLVRQLDGNKALRGWLAENTEKKSRPLAKFEVASAGQKRPANAADQAPRQVRFEQR